MPATSDAIHILLWALTSWLQRFDAGCRGNADLLDSIDVHMTEHSSEHSIERSSTCPTVRTPRLLWPLAHCGPGHSAHYCGGRVGLDQENPSDVSAHESFAVSYRRTA